MIAPPCNARVWLATGATDMRRGMNSLALPIQQVLQRDPPCRLRLRRGGDAANDDVNGG
jgi:hypothetical protein